MTEAVDYQVCPVCHQVMGIDREDLVVLHKRKDLIGDGKKGYSGSRACLGSFKPWREPSDQ